MVVADRTGLTPNIVESDYVIDWLLAVYCNQNAQDTDFSVISS